MKRQRPKRGFHPPNPPLETGVRHAGCSHLVRPGERCSWCGHVEPSRAPLRPPLPKRKRAA